MNDSKQRTPNEVRHLTRGNNGKIGGVCDGASIYFGIDVTIVRIVTVVAILSTGVLFLAYLAAWVIMPKATDQPLDDVASSSWRSDKDNAKLFGWGAIILAVLIVIPRVDLLPVGVWPLALIGFGIYLITRDGEETETPERQTHQSSTQQEPATAQGVSGHTTTEATPIASSGKNTPVTQVVISVLSVGLGVGLLGHLNNWWTLSLTHSFAIIMLGSGIGLLVAAFIGRAPGLIAIGLIASLGMAASVVLDPIIEDGAGERGYKPSSLVEVRDEYRLGAGELVVDLRDINLNGTQQTIDFHLTAGSLIIFVPSDVDLAIEATATVGEIKILESRSIDGIRLDDSFDFDSASEEKLTIDANVTFGEVVVKR